MSVTTVVLVWRHSQQVLNSHLICICWFIPTISFSELSSSSASGCVFYMWLVLGVTENALIIVISASLSVALIPCYLQICCVTLTFKDVVSAVRVLLSAD